MKNGYLVLQRKLGEQVILTLPGGEEVVIEVMDTARERARLAVRAPLSVRVDRAEVLAARRQGLAGQPAALPGGVSRQAT